nr:MarR family winged helix-turn-helix transcriptional regulator [uncultured Holophaga sp.]
MADLFDICWSEAPLPLLLTVVRGRLRQISLRHLAPFDLTHQQFQVMALVEKNPGICHKNVAAALGLDKPTATRLLQTLQKKGWLSVQPDQGHGRRLCITLSPEGTQHIAQLSGMRRFFREGLEEGLSPEERQQLRGLLHKLMTNLDRLEERS